MQNFNDVGEFLSQEFVAGDDVEYETENCDPINEMDMPLAGNEYHPFDMLEPKVVDAIELVANDPHFKELIPNTQEKVLEIAEEWGVVD